MRSLLQELVPQQSKESDLKTAGAGALGTTLTRKKLSSKAGADLHCSGVNTGHSQHSITSSLLRGCSLGEQSHSRTLTLNVERSVSRSGSVTEGARGGEASASAHRAARHHGPGVTEALPLPTGPRMLRRARLSPPRAPGSAGAPSAP